MKHIEKNIHWFILTATVIGFSILLSLTVSIKTAITDFYAHHTLIAENKSWKTAYEDLEAKHTNFIVKSMEFAATTSDMGTLVVWTESECDSTTRVRYLKKYHEIKTKFNKEKAKNIEIEMQ